MLGTLLQVASAPAATAEEKTLPGLPAAENPVKGKSGADVLPRKRDKESKTSGKRPKAVWPKAGTTLVNLSSSFASAGEPRQAKELPIAVKTLQGDPTRSSESREATSRKIEIGVLGREATEKAGVAGVLFTLKPRGGKPGKVGASVDYSSFAEAYGGGYASRLSLVKLPSCVLDTPNKAECRSVSPVETVNDAEKQNLTAKSLSLNSSGTTVLAAVAEAQGGTGDFRATPLSPSSAWGTSLNTGDFTWSYDIPVPDVPSGMAPNVGLSYSSGNIDGQTGMTNNQSSWAGNGFNLWPGFIERRYKPCYDDGVENADGGKPADQCWDYDNAFITFNGKGGELVPVGADEYKLKNDDGTRIKKLASTNRANGDSDGEYWRLTDPQGTRYYFGYNRLPGWSDGEPATNSAWTVPVYGDDDGEPCHAATFADSWCQQAWRWNLDYAVDTHGNAIAYYYTKEDNSYGRNLTAEDDTRYTRGGYLNRIEYGLNSSSMYGTKAQARVQFSVSERCIPDSLTDCSSIEEDAFYWYDTPWDMNCDAGEKCDMGRLAPTFFTRNRLTGVTTEVLQGDAYAKVDSWKLEHRWEQGDVDYQLLLDSVQRTGHTATTPVALPKTTLAYTQMENRLDKTGDGYAPFVKARLSTVDDEHGGRVSVDYSTPACAWDALPTPENNTTRCFPQYIGGDSTDSPERQWFNKYVVTSVTVSDRTGGAPDQVTAYEYLGGGAWHYDDDDGLTKEKYKTWSQWRGYGHVRVKTGGAGGASALKSQQDTYYLRGMHGDRAAVSGGTKTVSVSLGEGEGDPITDHESAAGFAYKTVTHSGPGGKVLEKSVSRPWHHETAEKVRDWGTVTANFTGVSQAKRWTSLDDGAGEQWRVTSTATQHDTVAGRAVMIDDFGDNSTAGDNRCTRITYATNEEKNLLALPARQETVSVACSASPDRSKDVVSDVRNAYDGGAYGQAPTKGDATATATLKSHDGTEATYLESGSAYDAYGRQLTNTDLTANVTVSGSGDPVRTARTDGRTTTTAYSPATGLPTTITETSPPATAGDTSTALTTTTLLDPVRGLPVKQTDANGKATELEYDALGRTSKVWLPDRRTSQVPSYQFTYYVNEGEEVAIRTQTVNNSGGQTATYVIYDGALRERQTQSPGPDGGRIITDVFYDERGLTAKTFAPYYTGGTPQRGLFAPNDALSLETQYRHTYDGLGRETETRQIAGNGDGGTVLATTKTVYGGDRTTMIPPEGGTATTTVFDARGQATELHQHHEPGVSAPYDTTAYAYNPRGELAKVTDPAGNSWTYTYDQMGRPTEVKDPDKGTTTIRYDDRDQVTTSTDARGTLANVYDGLGRRTELREDTVAGALRAKWVYDTVLGARGQLAESVRYADGAAYTSKVTQYDQLYRPVRTAVVVPEKEGVLAGTYQTGTSYFPSGLLRGLSYSAAGALSGGGYSYTYDQETLRPTSILGNGFQADTNYSLTGKPLQHQLKSTASGAKTVQITNTYEWGTQRLATSRVDRQDVLGVDRHHTYGYDQAGNILSISDVSRAGTDTQCFAHDHLRRLTEAWTQGEKTCAAAPAGDVTGGVAPYWHSYTYDKTGNRLTETIHDPTGDSTKDTSRTYAYPEHGGPQPHTLTSVTTEGPGGTTQDTYEYNATGDTTKRTVSGVPQTLMWDAEGRLTSVTEPVEDAGDKTTRYVYDAGGNRLIRRTDTETTLYLGHTEVTLPNGATEAKATRYTALGGGNQAVTADNGSVTFTLADHQGTGQLAVNAADLDMAQRRTLPFGGPRGTEPDDWPGSKGFVGGTDDTGDTGLVHLGAREYDTTTGRFLSVDPVMDLLDPQQLNGYAYTENSPITFSDSTGQWKWLDDRIQDVKDFGSGLRNGIIDGYYDLAEGWYSFTDLMRWTKGNAQKIKNDRAGKGPVSVYKSLRAPDRKSRAYNAGHWIGKFITPFIPGAPMAGAGVKAASQSPKAIRALRGIFSGPPKPAEARVLPRAAAPSITPRGLGGKHPPVVEVQKAQLGWTHADKMQEAASQVPGFALKNEKSAVKKTKGRTYAGGYNIETGDIALASSGGLAPGCGYCAEGNVVRALGGDASKVRFTIAYRVERVGEEFAAMVKPVCHKCQVDFPNPFQFQRGVTGREGGEWEKQLF